MINITKLINLHNKARSKGTMFSGPKDPLTEDKQLSRFAQKWAEFMASSEKLQHSSMSSILDLGFSRSGENIAYGQRSEEQVMKTWLKSYGHKRNIMNSSFTHIGCGFAYSKKGTIYWCVCFGRKD
jgi:uncharacterized protein YkwD